MTFLTRAYNKLTQSYNPPKMSKKSLGLTRFTENQFKLQVNGDYFGTIKAIPNQEQTEYAIIYTQQISAISGPPMDREIYIGKTDSLSNLEKMSEAYSKKIAKDNNFSFKNKANLSANIPEPLIVDKSKSHKRYNVRETPFTKGSRLNH